MLNSTVSTYRVNIHEFSHLTNSIFAKVKNNVVFLKYITNSNNVAMLLSTFQEHSLHTQSSLKQSNDRNKESRLWMLLQNRTLHLLILDLLRHCP